MITVLMILLIIASILLIFIILAQSPKGGGLTNIGSGASQYLGARQTADVLEKSTWYFGLGVLAIVIMTFFFTTGSNNEGDVRKSKTEGVDYAPGFLQNNSQPLPGTNENQEGATQGQEGATEGQEAQPSDEQPKDIEVETPAE